MFENWSKTAHRNMFVGSLIGFLGFCVSVAFPSLSFLAPWCWVWLPSLCTGFIGMLGWM